MAQPKVLSTKEADIQMMLSAEVHLGTTNCDFQMERYVFKRRNDGIYIINMGKTWEKLQMAARVIVAIENPQDIIVQSARPYGQRAVLKFAQHTGCQAIAGRHTPGTFTNQLQTSFSEPRLLILTDPRTDHQPIKEAALGNIPTIAFCDTDSPMRYVDIGIPANNKGKHSIGCLFWLLARMVLQMRGVFDQGHKWHVMVDLFFYREPEEAKEQNRDDVDYPADYTAGMCSNWSAQILDAQWVGDMAPPPIAGSPVAASATGWTGAQGKLIQEDMDEQQSVANDINKILRGAESMSNKLEDLSSRVQHMEEELQNIQKNQPEFPLISDEESKEDQNLVLPDYRSLILPTFPENFKDLKVFRKWKKCVDSCFEGREIPYEIQGQLVAETFPKNFPWWEQIQKLSQRIDNDDKITWREIKKMFIVQFFSSDCLLSNKDRSSPPKNTD
ncbi:40S ribosomal protein Sa-2 isoform X2 [Lactuca sativa]|uniref:40S ribosomal protein Sa-2 isoform X2 n=1 Tax=Lactuca sativa TaxID=4236 RepID=UPI000CD8107F|nr:40S ribosomal protein Sa-2 isoform X2 [Lactuca sativa]